MLNLIWLFLIVAGVLLGGFSGRMKPVVDGAVEGAASAVTLALALIGIMALWLGLMRLAERAGVVQAIARALRPVLCRLFPEVPAGHPAMASMVMNLAANMLGLNNAATPLGLRAMRDLETLNPHPGTATNAMCTFLAINTSSVQLLPMTSIAVLAAKGSANPTAVVGTALLATICSTAAGILSVKWLERRGWFSRGLENPLPAAAAAPPSDAPAPEIPPGLMPEAVPPLPVWGRAVLVLFAMAFLWLFIALVQHPPPAGAAGSLPVRALAALSLLAVPFLAAFFPLCAAVRRIPVYEEFVEGAREGFQVAVRIIPYLVAMLVAIGIFRGGGGIEIIARALNPLLGAIGFPPELLPMALVRPLSGSGSIAMLSDVVTQFGPDHLLSRTAATILGSTETTFYVVAVYFGSVAVRRTRHAIPAGLIADAVGIMASVLICRWFF